MIAFFELSEKGFYFSYAYFNSLLYELDEYVEYHEIMTIIAKTIWSEVHKNQIPEDETRSFLSFTNSSVDKVPAPTRLGNRTTSSGSFTLTDAAANQAPLDPLAELKTVIRFQYNKMLEIMYDIGLSRASNTTEIYARLYEGLMAIKVTIIVQHPSRHHTLYALRFHEHEVSKVL